MTPSRGDNPILDEEKILFQMDWIIDYFESGVILAQMNARDPIEGGRQGIRRFVENFTEDLRNGDYDKEENKP